jgi:hypothetical protein
VGDIRSGHPRKKEWATLRRKERRGYWVWRREKIQQEAFLLGVQMNQ